jgi:hypothetical protein
MEKLTEILPHKILFGFFLKFYSILLSASTEESIDSYCVDWDGLTILTYGKPKTKVIISCEVMVPEYKSCFDFSSSVWRHFWNHSLIKLVQGFKRSLP